jgi:dolichol-phosphate mannosyltransferase
MIKVEAARAAMRVAVIIPSFKVTAHVAQVIGAIGPEVSDIIVVDDACPDGSGKLVAETVKDPRVAVVFHAANQGVGGAVISGYRKALELGCDVAVKVDGDGQMDPALIPRLIKLIELGEADYVKGNRFYVRKGVEQMPAVRLLGNAILSFLTKISSGYWSVFDPTNGFTAIHAEALRLLDFERLSKRYFFESDMLIQLGDMRATVRDMQMTAVYANEVSGLKIGGAMFEFAWRHAWAALRRVIYWYFIRDFSLGSVNLLLGLGLLAFGATFGGEAWVHSIRTGEAATAGTVMLATLPILVAIQMILSFLALDIANEPKAPLQRFATPKGDALDANVADVKQVKVHRR